MISADLPSLEVDLVDGGLCLGVVKRLVRLYKRNEQAPSIALGVAFGEFICGSKPPIDLGENVDDHCGQLALEI